MTQRYFQSVMAVTVEALDFNALEQAGGVTFNEEQREALVRAADDYLTDLSEESEAPRSGDLRAHLKNLETHSKALARLVNDPEALPAVGEAFPWDRADPATFTGVLRELTTRARGARKKLTAPKGRPQKQGRTRLLHSLYQQWREAGGQGKGIWWNPYEGEWHGSYLCLANTLLEQLREYDRRVETDGIPAACRKAAAR